MAVKEINKLLDLNENHCGILNWTVQTQQWKHKMWLTTICGSQLSKRNDLLALVQTRPMEQACKPS
jgi:hypothetical protein